MYVTIDPGVTNGWALWCCDELIACGLGDPRQHGLHVVTSKNPDADTVDDVWIERPVIYPRSKARPNDIVKLATDAGEWAGMYRACGVERHYVEPAEWKGQAPKDVHHARVWSKLTDDERDVVNEAVRGIAPSKRHNVLDAVGLGLFVAKRLGK